MDIKPIRTEADDRAALAEIARLMDLPEGSLSPAGSDRLDVLAVLVEDHERRHHPLPQVDPIAAIAAHAVLLGARTAEIGMNGASHWQNIPEAVWATLIGGYQVLKKWLSDRDGSVLGRALTAPEVEHVTATARRLAAIRLLGPALDDSYRAGHLTRFRPCIARRVRTMFLSAREVSAMVRRPRLPRPADPARTGRTPNSSRSRPGPGPGGRGPGRVDPPMPN